MNKTKVKKKKKHTKHVLKFDKVQGEYETWTINLGIEWVIVAAYLQLSNLLPISWREQVNFQWDDDEGRFVLDQHS